MELNYIIERIESKKLVFDKCNFTQAETNALTTFFDLAQEFDSIEDFYRLCVFIPKVFFNLDARLYLIVPKLNKLALVAQTRVGVYELFSSPPPDIIPNEQPYYTSNNNLVLPIRGKKLLIDQLPFKTKDDILDLLKVYTVINLSPHQELFFEKFANRIGFNIHNRFLVEKNIEHLKFVKTLVADIEHNVITPNIIYKFFLKQIRKKL